MFDRLTTINPLAVFKAQEPSQSDAVESSVLKTIYNRCVSVWNHKNFGASLKLGISLTKIGLGAQAYAQGESIVRASKTSWFLLPAALLTARAVQTQAQPMSETVDDFDQDQAWMTAQQALGELPELDRAYNQALEQLASAEGEAEWADDEKELETAKWNLCQTIDIMVNYMRLSSQVKFKETISRTQFIKNLTIAQFSLLLLDKIFDYLSEDQETTAYGRQWLKKSLKTLLPMLHLRMVGQDMPTQLDQLCQRLETKINLKVAVDYFNADTDDHLDAFKANVQNLYQHQVAFKRVVMPILMNILKGMNATLKLGVAGVHMAAMADLISKDTQSKIEEDILPPTWVLGGLLALSSILLENYKRGADIPKTSIDNCIQGILEDESTVNIRLFLAYAGFTLSERLYLLESGADMKNKIYWVKRRLGFI